MLLPASLAGLQNRALADPQALWNICHLSRRAGVLVLLVGPGPDFQTVLTVRSGNLSYAGDVAFPGGKSDQLEETPWDVALREANEEIGLDPRAVHPVRTFPGYISSKRLMVVPSIGWTPSMPSQLAPLSATEVHKVFSAPLSRFLPPVTGRLEQFNLLASKKQVGYPMYDRVWGLTAHILIDTARLVFQREPQFEFFRGKQRVVSDGCEIGNMAVLKSLASKQVLQSKYGK